MLLLYIHKLKIISEDVSNWYFMTPPHLFYSHLLQDILHQFYVLLSSLRCWWCCCCCLWLVLLEKQTVFSHDFAWLSCSPFVGVMLRKYDALCMLTTQHSILHFILHPYEMTCHKKRYIYIAKFKFIGFIKVCCTTSHAQFSSLHVKVWFMAKGYELSVVIVVGKSGMIQSVSHNTLLQTIFPQSTRHQIQSDPCIHQDRALCQRENKVFDTFAHFPFQLILLSQKKIFTMM